MAARPPLVAQGLTKVYRTGELAVLQGPSGSGKSTLLNILGGLDTPTSGQIRFRYHVLSAADEAALTRYRREHVGFVFQFYNLLAAIVDGLAEGERIVLHPSDRVGDGVRIAPRGA